MNIERRYVKLRWATSTLQARVIPLGMRVVATRPKQ